MYTTKSFVTILPLVKNQVGVDNAIGEITAHSRTFTKNLGMYHNVDYHDFDLRNFLSIDGGQYESLSASLVDKAMTMVNVAWQKTQSQTGPIDRAQLLQDLIVMGASNGMSQVSIGTMVTDFRYWLPSWIRFTNTEDTRENIHTVWLSDGDFRKDYDDYIIDVVPILDRLDDFFLPAAQVKILVDAVKTSQIMERLDARAAGAPATYRSADEYEYNDPNNTNNRFDVPFPANVYTDIGYDADLIKDAIVQHILDNSSHSSDEWAKIFPDLFKRTEFIIAPWWNKYAAGAKSLQHGVHSPIVTGREAEPWAIRWAPNYSVPHTQANYQIIGFQFRSIVCSAIGHMENRDQKHKLTDIYPDYMNVPTGPGEDDFNRMSLKTQAWSMLMIQLLNAADEWTGTTQLPRGILRVKRGNFTYLAASHERVSFLVLTKMSVVENT